MAKAVRNNVAACRLTDEQVKSITDKLKAKPIRGAPTPGLLARKLLLDWDDSELRWKTKERESTTRELFQARKTLEANRNGAPKAKKAKAAAPAPSVG